jgi:hypothetical protein
MARLARVVIPDHPHHVTERGNGRARTFFSDADRALVLLTIVNVAKFLSVMELR